MYKKFRRWFYSKYFSLLMQPQLIKLEIMVELGSDRNDGVDRRYFVLNHLFLKFHYRIDIKDAPFWWKGAKHFLMTPCFEPFWYLGGLRDELKSGKWLLTTWKK